MKILHINTSDRAGGAAIAAFRLHDAMLKSGIESKYLVLNRTIYDRADIKTVSASDRLKRIVNMVFESIATKNMRSVKGLFSSFKYGIDISRHPAVLEADIIYIHWVNSFINYRVLKKILKIGKQVYWFMHDTFAITGGCHIIFNCTNYQTQCGKCPYHGTGIAFTDLSRKQFKIKRRIYNQFNNLAFIAPSKWLFDCAQKSGLTQNKRIYHIPNLIDTNVFKPVNKDIARQLFSIDTTSKKIIGFGGHGALVDPRKGFIYLIEALQIVSKDDLLKDMPIELLVFGNSYNKEIAEKIPFPVHFLGMLHDEYSLVMVYNSMNIFVIPSLEDNFPNTILESISCGTPVVGFNVCGVPDTVNVNTGYLAEYKNSEDLAKGISFLLHEQKINVSTHISAFMPEQILKRHNILPPPPPRLRIIGFGADAALANFNKGFAYLRDALQILSKDNSLQMYTIEVLVFGSSYSKEMADSIPFPSYFLGNLLDEYSLVMAYNCMDVFVIPSLADNFPNTILESLACGTPVVGFNVGGIPDMVNVNTGYLAEYKNSEDLAKGISFLLKKNKNKVNAYIKSFIKDAILTEHKKMRDTKSI